MVIVAYAMLVDFATVMFAKLTRLVIPALAACLASSSLESHATTIIPITGKISFFGEATVTEAADVVQISFPSQIDIVSGTGSYSSIDFTSTFAAFSSVQFNDLTNTLLAPSGLTPLFSFADNGLDYSFTLTSLLTGNHFVDDLGNASLSFSAAGYANITGFATTYGTFSFGGSGEQPGIEFVANTINKGQPVPDGGNTAILLGVSLLGIGAISRRARSVFA